MIFLNWLCYTMGMMMNDAEHYLIFYPHIKFNYSRVIISNGTWIKCLFLLSFIYTWNVWSVRYILRLCLLVLLYFLVESPGSIKIKWNRALSGTYVSFLCLHLKYISGTSMLLFGWRMWCNRISSRSTMRTSYFMMSEKDNKYTLVYVWSVIQHLIIIKQKLIENNKKE